VVIPAAWYMLRFFQGVVEGPAPDAGPVAKALSGASAKLADLRWQEWLALIPLIALIFYLGIAPATMTSRTEAATQQILTTTQHIAPGAVGATHGG